MLRLFAILVLCGVTRGDESCGTYNSLIFRSIGNITITGILNGHEGKNCSVAVSSGLEHAAAAMWTVGVLNQFNYIPDMKIGLTLLDGCGNHDEMKKSFVQSLVMENCLKTGATPLGVFTTQDIGEELAPLASGLNQTITKISPIISSSTLFIMISELLREMSINTIHRVIAETSTILTEFGRKMAHDGICVYDQVIVDDTHAVNNDALEPSLGDTESELVTDGPPVILIIAGSRTASKLLETLRDGLLKLKITWFIALTDSAMDIPKERLPNGCYVLSAVLPKSEQLEDFIRNPDVIGDPLNHRLPLKSPFFLSTALAVLKILSPLKNITGAENLDNADLFSSDIHHVLNSIQTPPDDEMFLFTVTESNKTDDVAIFQIYNTETLSLNPKLLMIKSRKKRSIARIGIQDIKNLAKDNVTLEHVFSTTEEIIIREKKIGKHPCHDLKGNLSKNCGICQNFLKYLSKVAEEKKLVADTLEPISINWRFETWVEVNASVTAIGVLCAITIFTFIMTRICMGDILEGSPALSFFLLIAIVISYLATLPFSFQATGGASDGDQTLIWAALLCDLRLVGPPLSYSILFSILLSRSLMLAASDQDGGFMSHVNGYLQAVLIFFICAVQFVLSGEYWLLNSFIHNPTILCQSMYSNHKFIILSAYNAFLLLLLVSTIPFMIRSKRNYREGTFFSVAIITVVLVWSTWISLFYGLGEAYSDAAVVFGLTATATAILVSIFIPRTYLMTTAIVRDRIVNTLPPLVHSEHQFRSTQALYDTLNLTNKIGVSNPNFYAINPTTTDSGPGTPQIRPGEYYSSDAGLRVPTLRISKEKTNKTTNDSLYEGFDSPIHQTPKHVTRF